MSYILENILDQKLSLIVESEDLKNPRSTGYTRQYAEDMLYHTIGPLTDNPRWVNSPWSSDSPEPDGYEPGGQAYHWSPEEVVIAFAGDPSKMFTRSSDSPRSGRMGGSPMFRLAKRIARKFGRESDNDFIEDIFSNGFIPLTKMMHKGFDEGRKAFIPYVIRSVQGAMESGPGGDKAAIKVIRNETDSTGMGLKAALSSDDSAEIRKYADMVKGEYRVTKSHEKDPDNPYQFYSKDYYDVMHNYADALDSGEPDRIEAAKNLIRQTIDSVIDSNPTIRGAASGMAQAISNKDRGAASGEAKYLVKAKALDKILNTDSPDQYKNLMKKIDELTTYVERLESKISVSKDANETERLSKYRALIKLYISAALSGRDTTKLREKTDEEIKKHLDSKKFGIASMDVEKDSETGGGTFGSTLSDNEHEDNWLDPEMINYILNIAINYDLSSILSKNSKWVKMAEQLGSKATNPAARMTANEFRFVIRSLGPLGSNYPGKGNARSNTSMPREARNWWKPGEDPEIEPIPRGGLWNSIWKRNGYPAMGQSEIAEEMTSEAIEFSKLGIRTTRMAGLGTKKLVMTRVNVGNHLREAKIKLQIIAAIHKEQLGISESSGMPQWVSRDQTDRMIISECATALANRLQRSLILESARNIYEDLIIK